MDALALELVETLRKEVASAMEDPHLWEQVEHYTVIFVEAIRNGPSGEEVLGRADLARLLLGETAVQELSARRAAGRHPAPLQLRQGRPGGHRLEQRLRLRAVRVTGHPGHPGDLQRPAARAPLLRRRARPQLARIYERLQRERRAWVVESSAAPTAPSSRRVLVDAAGDERVRRAGGELAEDHRRLLPGQGLRGGGGAAAHPRLEGSGHPEAADPRQRLRLAQGRGGHRPRR